MGVTRANAPEADVTGDIAADLAAQGATLAEAHIDRAYLSSALVRERRAGRAIYCKAWPVQQGNQFAKTAFQLDWDRGMLTCPQGAEMPFTPGGSVHFPAATCAACPVRARCTDSARGRSVSIHRDERLLEGLRERQQTAAGRALARAGRGRAHPGPHRGLARRPRPLPRPAQEPSSTCAAPPWSRTCISSSASPRSLMPHGRPDF